MSEDTAAKISLKLVVDRNANRVIFAEAGKDFVDFLIHFLSLPVGTVVNLLSSGKMIGSIGKIYESIEAMDPNYLEPNINKQNILNPKLSATTTLPGHTPQLLSYKSHEDDDHVPNDMKSLYLCSQQAYNCYNVSTEIDTICPQCSFVMDTELTLVNSTTSSSSKQAAVEVEKRSSGGGYVKGLLTYMVMDDLTVKPMSTICSSITLLTTFQVKDLTALETMEVSIGRQEAVELLKASLLTDKVLTSLFLGKNKVSVEREGIVKTENVDVHDVQGKSIEMKEIAEEIADIDAKLEDLQIVNGLRKSRREIREPTWLKDFVRRKPSQC